MPFDLDGARKAGYSDAEISDFMAQSSPKFDVQGALKSGYSLDDIAGHLGQAAPETPQGNAPGSAGGALLRGIPVGGAYIPNVEAAIRATMHPLTGVGKPGESWSERYAANVPQREAAAQKYDVENPVTSTALKIGGGTAALGPIGMTAAGGRALGMTGASLMGRAGAGATTGGLIGAADAAARGEDIETGAKHGVLGGAAGPLLGRVLAGRPVPAGGTTPLTTGGIREAASEGYNATRAMARERPITPALAQSTSDEIGNVVSQQVSPALAKQAHGLIDDLGKAKTLSDWVDVREKLGHLVRDGSGRERQAAIKARALLDNELDLMTPGKTGVAPTSAAMGRADTNYAIASQADEMQSAITDAIRKGKEGGSRVGTRIQNVVDPLLRADAENVSPAVQAAARRITAPGAGPRALKVASVTDPSRGFGQWGAAMGGPLALLGGGLAGGAIHGATMAGGYGAGRVYDRLMQQRAAQLIEAMRRGAPATQAMPGYVAPQMQRPNADSLLSLAGIPFAMQQ